MTAQGMESQTEMNECPKCGAEALAVGKLGQGQFVGDTNEPSPEPWRDVATCPSCGSKLQRYEGESWHLAPP
jgi:ssDNA-binding Zn-finger/Zn-ribbon topoisomerase 1